MIAALLDQLERSLALARSDYLLSLQPGVSEASLDLFHARFSIPLPEEFRELDPWRNGQAPDCHELPDRNRMFSPLEDVADTKSMFDAMIGTDFEDPSWWRLGWIPFLSNGAGDHLCVDVEATDDGSPGQLIAFWHDWNHRTIEHPSLAAWLATLVRTRH